MNTQYQIMTFAANGNPIPIEIRKHTTREQAEQRLEELKLVYDVPMSIREVK